MLKRIVCERVENQSGRSVVAEYRMPCDFLAIAVTGWVSWSPIKSQTWLRRSQSIKRVVVVFSVPLYHTNADSRRVIRLGE
jgi:hypothetical protein